jgi:8-amino-7-oxononanoate synthase
MLKNLNDRKKNGNLRELSLLENLIDFASNDYLGLARSPKLASLISSELSKHTQTGSTGSRLLTGNSRYAEKLEDSIAAFHGFEAGLLFNCGYMANVGLLSTVASHMDCIFFDAHIHASTRDGITLSKAHSYPFRHNDSVHLENRLKNTKANRKFICIESVYSGDGSRAPLSEIYRLAKEYDAHLIVDEAHAVGICGHQGRGLSSNVFSKTVTFGKALGTHGAIVLGSHTLKQALINFATPFIYTTALPFYSLAAIKCSYDLFPGMDRERNHIQKLAPSHIQSIPVKGAIAAKALAQKIRESGFDVRALLSPTVQRGKEVLRICLHAFNTENELKALFEVIHE